MRPVRGFDRPVLQWAFVAIGLLLVAIAAGEAVGLRRAQSVIAALRAADLNARTERQQLDTRLAREQAARESFALELGRVRGAATASTPEPTLTLAPLSVRRATPPDATVAVPAPAQTILLRLLLPGGRVASVKRYAVALRTWSNGDVVWSRSDLRTASADGKAAVTARLTGDVLVPGAYEVRLTDVSQEGSPVDVAFYEIAVAPSGS
ncbi:MAG: hypothetical protein V7647_3083 [Acidobacteriota bacterium]|jgi:hypothetical protein